MTDVLIRDVPEDDLRRIDARAERMGIGRAEFLRRQIAREASRPVDGRESLALDSFRRLAELTTDMLEPDFEQRAWS